MNTETRPGIRTTEFWLVIISNLLINVGAVDVGDAKIRGAFAVLSVLGYTISRGLAKAGVANDAPVIVPVDPPDPAGVKASGLSS